MKVKLLVGTYIGGKLQVAGSVVEVKDNTLVKNGKAELIKEEKEAAKAPTKGANKAANDANETAGNN